MATVERDTPDTAGAPRLYGRDAREIGECAARVSGMRARYAVRLLARWAKRYPGLLEPAARVRSRGLARGDNLPPGVSRELEGLSRGLRIPVDDLAVARAVIESLAAPRCTNFGAAPPATSGESPMLSWNFDASILLKMLMGRFPFYVRELEGTAPYLCVGVPALYGIGILNAEGLS